MKVVIRTYRPSDRAAVVSLFRNGIQEHIRPSFHNAVTSPLYVTISLALCVAGYLFGSTLGAVTLPGVWLGLLYFCCHELYSGYVRKKLQTDMQDISGNYLSTPGSCFWVAEAEVHGRTQIVGIVAVMAKQNGKERYGELFRMIISPLCRRMGLGSRMSHTVFDFCKEQGFSKVVLETSSTQVAAVSLYEKLGFTHIPLHGKPATPLWLVMLARVTIIKMEKHLQV